MRLCCRMGCRFRALETAVVQGDVTSFEPDLVLGGVPSARL
jgi:hypothetical protein